MREVQANAWRVRCDVLAITTNKTIKGGRNVMGAGIAGEAARRDSDLPYKYAACIQRFGHHVFLLDMSEDENAWGPRGADRRPILMFPTKQEVWEPSDLDTIGDSLYDAKQLSNIYGWGTIAIPRPGAGLGGLDWHKEVKPFLEETIAELDADFPFGISDCFLFVSRPGEPE